MLEIYYVCSMSETRKRDYVERNKGGIGYRYLAWDMDLGIRLIGEGDLGRSGRPPLPYVQHTALQLSTYHFAWDRVSWTPDPLDP
jgi:hypothetical protein